MLFRSLLFNILIIITTTIIQPLSRITLLLRYNRLFRFSLVLIQSQQIFLNFLIGIANHNLQFFLIQLPQIRIVLRFIETILR